MTFFLIVLIYSIGIRIGAYKIFQKNGIAGWKAFVPVLCSIEWYKLVGCPTWWTAWLFVPGVNLFYWAGQLTRMSTAHGKRDFLSHFLAVMAAPVYWPWLAFNKEIRYISTNGLKPGQPEPKKSAVREWTDSILFALVAATIIRGFVLELYTIPTSSMEKTLLIGDFLFVSKFHYGARVPMTPLAIPIFHHTIPGTTTPAYLEWIKLPYYRLPGLEKIKRNDMVVFNFPAGDTIVQNLENPTYYDLVRQFGKENVTNSSQSILDMFSNNSGLQTSGIKTRPVDKRENYIKRCVGISGDKIQVKEGVLYVNDKLAFEPEHMYKPFTLILDDGISLNENLIKEFDILNKSAESSIPLPANHYYVCMEQVNADKLKSVAGIKSITPYVDNVVDTKYKLSEIFPQSSYSKNWTKDNMGPLVVPKKGMTITLNDSTVAMYGRCITTYEHNQLESKDGKYLINGNPATTFTFAMDYFWMMGDNRHNSQDARYWGFVPEDHIVGKPWFVWLSLDYNADLLHKIRWNRIFKFIHKNWAPTDPKYTD